MRLVRANPVAFDGDDDDVGDASLLEELLNEIGARRRRRRRKRRAPRRQTRQRRPKRQGGRGQRGQQRPGRAQDGGGAAEFEELPPDDGSAEYYEPEPPRQRTAAPYEEPYEEPAYEDEPYEEPYEEEYEDEAMAGLARRRGWSVPARMGRLRVQAPTGLRAAVMELRPGLYLVAEVEERQVEQLAGPLVLATKMTVSATKALAERAKPQPKALPAPPAAFGWEARSCGCGCGGRCGGGR